jgi:N-methylhydantoinase A
LLHSFRNRAHEERVRAIAESAGVQFVSISSEVAPEIREYERASTTVANAYVQPATRTYLAELRRKLNDLGYRKELFVMLSSGGIATSEEAEHFPVRLLESGPAAGAMAASFYGSLTASEPILSFDMGGTTAKLCLIEKGKPLVTPEFEAGRVYRFKKGSGLPIRVLAVEMIEIGAGGGSIARMDGMGLLKVGPESAGADPGPVCYGRGGIQPTVTDADLVLGYLDAGYFLGGRMQLSREKAVDAIARLGTSANLDTLHAAWGIHRVVNASMANAATVYAAEKGRDLRRYAMVAFGGASPAHACAVADELGSKRVVVPFAAGVSSAFGLLVTRPSIERVKAHMSRLSDLDWDEILNLYREMEEEGRGLLRRMGIRDGDIQVRRQAEMRYCGQRHQITVTIPPRAIEDRQVAMIEQAFKQEYATLYQEIQVQYPVEALNWKTSMVGPSHRVKISPTASGSKDPASALKPARKVCFSPAAGYIECAVYDRYRLTPGSVVVGPSVIEEKECTTVVRPGWSGSVDGHLNIILTKTASSNTEAISLHRDVMAREKGHSPA